VSTAGRILALDVGDRRIGLAITDTLNLTAQPLFTLHRTNLRADLKSIARFMRQHSVTALVIGLPLNADATESAQSAKTRAFAKELQAAHPDMPLHWLDERLTTREAHALLDRGDRLRRSAGQAARAERKDFIDQVAAVLLLEAFLSHQQGPTLLPDPDAA
jgi:putative Holliday junction resolvase